MTPQTGQPDPDFVQALSASIRGTFAVEIDRFSAEKVESEFRKIVRDPNLVSNDGFMDNLMFVVRKKNILPLRPDVQAALQNLDLKPYVELSALKTLYAIGGQRERSLVDERHARRLYSDLKASDGIPTGPFLPAAERVGGPKTLTVLESALPEATARQRKAEAAEPGNHVRIGQLDKVRSSIDTQIQILSRKLKIAASPEPQRTETMLQLYLRNAPYLAAWCYRELVENPSPARIETARLFLASHSEPPNGALLLRAMKGELSPEEQKHQPDWEEVLDRN